MQVASHGMVFLKRSSNALKMKSRFQFFFTMIIYSGIFFSVIYALGGRRIEKQGGYMWFVMLAIVLIGVAGMLKNLVAEKRVEPKRVNR